jgi:hypothetical protein
MWERFNVVQFFPDGTSEYVANSVGPEEAVKVAWSFTERPAALLGIIRRVIITGTDDATVFEWRFGEGVTYPPREVA